MRLLNGALSAVVLGALLWAAPALKADGMKDPGPGRWDRFEMLKKKLDLSPGQVSQWKDAEKRQRESAKLLRDKVKADEAQLALLVDQKASDDDLKASLDTLDADHKALSENGQQLIERLRQILNPLQQAKAALMMGRMHGRHGGFGMECGPRGQGGGPQGGRRGRDGRDQGDQTRDGDQGGRMDNGDGD